MTEKLMLQRVKIVELPAELTLNEYGFAEDEANEDLTGTVIKATYQREESGVIWMNLYLYSREYPQQEWIVM
jgi:hypothetical protein